MLYVTLLKSSTIILHTSFFNILDSISSLCTCHPCYYSIWLAYFCEGYSRKHSGSYIIVFRSLKTYLVKRSSSSCQFWCYMFLWYNKLCTTWSNRHIESSFEKRVQKYTFAVKNGECKKVQATELLKTVISLWGQEYYQTAYNTSK